MSQAYSEIRNELKTGDLVLFSGKGAISTGIKFATLCGWSHVGMVLTLQQYDFVTIWESTTLSDIADLDSRELRKGVQLVPLSARVNQYKGEIAVRQLDQVSFDDDDVRNLMQLRREVSGKRYERSQMELIKAAYDGPFGHNEEDLSSLFCSELVAEAYQRLGLISEDKPSNEYTPSDFSEGRGLEMLKGKLGPEIIIKEE